MTSRRRHRTVLSATIGAIVALAAILPAAVPVAARDPLAARTSERSIDLREPAALSTEPAPGHAHHGRAEQPAGRGQCRRRLGSPLHRPARWEGARRQEPEGPGGQLPERRLAHHRRWRAGPARARLPPGFRDQPPPLRLLHAAGRRHRDRADAGEYGQDVRERRFAGNVAGHRAQRQRQPQRWRDGVRPGRVPVPRRRRRRRRRRSAARAVRTRTRSSARSCASTWTAPDPVPSVGYAIPDDNPFVGADGLDSIWAYGVRNPWRITFDRSNGNLYIADVGQSRREEVNLELNSDTGGNNYGWDVMEGTLCYEPMSGCSLSGDTLPVAEYSHSLGCSITGGYVYRGSHRDLQGLYVYGDFCSGRIWTMNASGTGETVRRDTSLDDQLVRRGRERRVVRDRPQRGAVPGRRAGVQRHRRLHVHRRHPLAVLRGHHRRLRRTAGTARPPA